jgi:hypothetical protein
MSARRYDIALIPCTKRKNPIGITPPTLYIGGPFSLMMNHARQRCDRIVIMSAHFGLLAMTDRVHNYEAYLPGLDEAARRMLALEIVRRQDLLDGGSICSYLPKAYYDFLVSVTSPELAARIRRPYRNLPMLSLYKVLSNEIKGYETGLARR